MSHRPRRQDDDSFFAPAGSGAASSSSAAGTSASSRAAREAEAQRLLLLARRGHDTRMEPSSEADYSAADATFFGVQQQHTTHAQAQLHGRQQHPQQTPQHQHQQQHQHEHQHHHPRHHSQYVSPPAQAYETSYTESYEDYGDQEIELDSYDTESSNVLDPDEDPEGWADRIDELAGVMEMSEAEARALRWGPALGPERGAPDLSVDEFRTLLDYHMDTTEWRFEETTGIAPGGKGATIVTANHAGLPFPAETHPIRVLGRGWGGREAGVRIDPTTAMRDMAPEEGLGTRVYV